MSKTYHVRDITLAPDGKRKLIGSPNPMKVLNGLCDQFLKDGIFEGKKISVCMHLEAKTGYLALILKKLGADVWVTSSNPLSTKDDVVQLSRKMVFMSIMSIMLVKMNFNHLSCDCYKKTSCYC